MTLRLIYNERLLVQEKIPYSKRGEDSDSGAGDRAEKVPRGCKVFIRFTISSVAIKRGEPYAKQ